MKSKSQILVDARDWLYMQLENGAKLDEFTWKLLRDADEAVQNGKSFDEFALECASNGVGSSDNFVKEIYKQAVKINQTLADLKYNK